MFLRSHTLVCMLNGEAEQIDRRLSLTSFKMNPSAFRGVFYFSAAHHPSTGESMWHISSRVKDLRKEFSRRRKTIFIISVWLIE